MQKSIEDKKKEFDEQLLVTGNKLNTLFVAICVLLSCFNIAFVSTMYTKSYNALYNIFASVIILSLVYIMNVATKWKSKTIRYVSLFISSIIEGIYLCTINDRDIILFLVCIIPISVVYFDKTVSLIYGLSSIITLIVALVNYIFKSGDTAYYIWNFYYSIGASIVLTVFSMVACKKIKNMMLNGLVEEYEIEKNKRDNAFAGRIQEGFLNHDFPSENSYEISARMIPAKDVGGDFYDFYMVDDSRIAMIIADVSGKGVPAALLMATAKTIIKDNIKNGISFEKALETANREVMNENKEMQFITIFICIVDLTTGKLNYINAGHIKPYVFNNSGECVMLDSKPDFIFGVRKDTRYHSREYNMNVGDKLFLCTDGVTERMDINNKLFGKDRVVKLLTQNISKSPSSILDNVIKSLDIYGKGKEQNDDITCMLFEYKDKKVLEPVITKKFDIINSTYLEMANFVKETLNNKNIPSSIVNMMAVATDEIVSNICKYAYKDDDKNKVVTISIQANNKRIAIEYKDSGKYFNPLNIVTTAGTTKVTEKSKIGGLGIQLTWNIMDKVVYNRVDDENVISVYKEY